MRRSLAFAGTLALLLTALAGCPARPARPGAAGAASPTVTASVSSGDALLQRAAAELRTVKTMRFALAVNGSGGPLGIRSVTGRVTSTGDADGKVRLDQAAAPAELSFVVKQPDLYVKGLTAGGWRRLPLSAATALYDPTALLSPERGVANLVGTASGAIDGREVLNGVQTYRVKGTLDGKALGVLAPGTEADTVGTLWIGVDRPLLYRASFPVPGQPGQVMVTLSDFDAAVAIKTP